MKSADLRLLFLKSKLRQLTGTSSSNTIALGLQYKQKKGKTIMVGLLNGSLTGGS